MKVTKERATDYKYDVHASLEVEVETVVSWSGGHLSWFTFPTGSFIRVAQIMGVARIMGHPSKGITMVHI